MSSEKLRYLKRNRGPSAPMDFTKLRQCLPLLGMECLVDLLCRHTQNDNVLNKALMVSTVIQLFSEDWEQVKSSIDYALHLPDYIRYNDSNYALILDAIKDALERLHKQVNKDFALHVAKYTFKQGQEMIERFEDDWNWTSSLNELETWIKKVNFA